MLNDVYYSFSKEIILHTFSKFPFLFFSFFSPMRNYISFKGIKCAHIQFANKMPKYNNKISKLENI